VCSKDHPEVPFSFRLVAVIPSPDPLKREKALLTQVEEEVPQWIIGITEDSNTECRSRNNQAAPAHTAVVIG